MTGCKGKDDMRCARKLCSGGGTMDGVDLHWCCGVVWAAAAHVNLGAARAARAARAQPMGTGQGPWGKQATTAASPFTSRELGAHYLHTSCLRPSMSPSLVLEHTLRVVIPSVSVTRPVAGHCNFATRTATGVGALISPFHSFAAPFPSTAPALRARSMTPPGPPP